MTLGRGLLAAFFIVGGILHFVLTESYANIVPPWLPSPITLVIVSGVFEIAGGIGVLIEKTQWPAGAGLVALSLAVLPANVQMLLDAHGRNASVWWQLVLGLRLPLQFVLIYWIVKSTMTKSPTRR